MSNWKMKHKIYVKPVTLEPDNLNRLDKILEKLYNHSRDVESICEEAIEASKKEGISIEQLWKIREAIEEIRRIAFTPHHSASSIGHMLPYDKKEWVDKEE